MNRLVGSVVALVAAATAVVVGVVAEPGHLVRLGFQLGVLGWLLLGATLLWRPVLLAPAMVGVAFPAAIAALGRTDATGAIVVATMLLVVTGELAGWAIDRRSIVPESRAVTARRVSALAGVAVGSAAMCGGVLAAAGLPAPGGVLPVVAGTAAAVGVLALAALRRW
jgi:hypothetical protein